MAEVNERTKKWKMATRNFQMLDSSTSEEAQGEKELAESFALALRNFAEGPDGLAAKRMLEISIHYVEIMDIDEDGTQLVFGFFGFAVLPPEDEEMEVEIPLLVTPIRYIDVAYLIIEKGLGEIFMSTLSEKLDEVADSAPKNN
ncbi:MAG: hypothetical protein HZA94_01740 [Candidatus Vogelbacteria bacterium]|nr:hypothetical protein [Candidatus Vogelbacteria bacterium]